MFFFYFFIAVSKIGERNFTLWCKFWLVEYSWFRWPECVVLWFRMQWWWWMAVGCRDTTFSGCGSRIVKHLFEVWEGWKPGLLIASRKSLTILSQSGRSALFCGSVWTDSFETWLDVGRKNNKKLSKEKCKYIFLVCYTITFQNIGW